MLNHGKVGIWKFPCKFNGLVQSIHYQMATASWYSWMDEIL